MKPAKGENLVIFISKILKRPQGLGCSVYRRSTTFQQNKKFQLVSGSLRPEITQTWAWAFVCDKRRDDVEYLVFKYIGHNIFLFFVRMMIQNGLKRHPIRLGGDGDKLVFYEGVLDGRVYLPTTSTPLH